MDAQAITVHDGVLVVPDRPVIPFVEGDGTRPDIWRASVRIFDVAVTAAYGGQRQIAWHEVLAGEKAYREVGEWLPAKTLVGIKGPRSVRASAASTSTRVVSSICTPAYGRCGGTAACPARYAIRSWSTW